jgi:hypothetical protein
MPPPFNHEGFALPTSFHDYNTIVEMFPDMVGLATSIELLRNGATANQRLPRNIFDFDTHPHSLE